MKKPESLMMSLGYVPEWSEGSVKPPIFQTSTFGFKTAEEGKRFFEIAYGKSSLEPGEQMGLIYSRLNNPNMQILEERLAALEQSEEAAAFVSGMSAISTVMLAYLKPGDTLIFSNEVYGGTHHFVHHYLKSIGVNVLSILDWSDTEQIEQTLQTKGIIDKVAMIYCETPANPTNTLVDLEAVVRLKKQLESRLEKTVIMAVDNTYLGPIWQKPLEFGADLVCYSATKFLNGHSDVIAGAVMGSKEAIGPVKGLRTFLGGMIAPYTAWLLTRSLETLHVRMNYQTENAQKLAQFLENHPKVKKVLFPGLESMSSSQREIYHKQCKSPGAMISIVLHGGEAEAFRFLNTLKLIKLAVSLGSNESLAQHPHSMTHSDVPDEEKAQMGIELSLVRISVGIEHADDLILDLKQALEKSVIYRIVFVVLLASLGGCSIQESQGELLVQQSILAHGGLNNYTNLRDFRYEKTSYTLDAQEIINDTLVQQFETPRFGTTILITEDSLRITLQNENIQTSKPLDSDQQNYKGIIEGANFVFFQPFKLKDKGAQIEYLGLSSPSFSEKPLEQIRVSYPNSDDIWYFFLDHETKYVLANAVDHNGKISLILNDSLQWHKNLFVHSRRRSFLSNSNFELIRLQASYKYKMLSVE